MWRRLCGVVLPFVVDGLVALALASGDKPTQSASPRMVSAPEFPHVRVERPGAGLPLRVADTARSAAPQAGKRSQVPRVLR